MYKKRERRTCIVISNKLSVIAASIERKPKNLYGLKIFPRFEGAKTT